MVDGTYDVVAKGLLGTLRGTIALASSGTSCTATADLNGVSQTVEGIIEGNAFSFAGKLDTPLGVMSYDITGTADGERLAAKAKTKVGTFKITGARV